MLIHVCLLLYMVSLAPPPMVPLHPPNMKVERIHHLVYVVHPGILPSMSFKGSSGHKVKVRYVVHPGIIPQISLKGSSGHKVRCIVYVVHPPPRDPPDIKLRYVLCMRYILGSSHRCPSRDPPDI